MAYYWQIESQNCHFETRYLHSVRPTLWGVIPQDAKRFNDIDVIDACRWLVKLGVSFSVKQYTCV